MPARIADEDFKKHFEGRLEHDHQSGCLRWTGCVVGTGYGRVRYKNKTRQTHRVAYMLAFGDIPKGKYVLHRCDTPACCNPDHLFLGDQFENMHDMIRKGRMYDRSGTRNGSSKLTEDDVREIRRLKADGMKQVRLAERFGVSTVAISLIVLRKKWVHVP